MKSKQYLIIDDKPADAKDLEKRLDKFHLLQVAALVTSVEAAKEVLATQSIDLIFLDIQLADQSGLVLLKATLNLPPVIIVSAYPEYAVDSYEIGKSADYLLKPFTDERLHIALTRALGSPNPASSPNSIVGENAILLKMGRKVQRFDYQSMDYAEAFGIYSKVFAGDQMNVVNERLSSLGNLLPSNIFIRVHKSYLINVNKISSYDRHNLWVGKAKIPIGISYRLRLKGLLSVFDTNDEQETD